MGKSSMLVGALIYVVVGISIVEEVSKLDSARFSLCYSLASGSIKLCLLFWIWSLLELKTLIDFARNEQ